MRRLLPPLVLLLLGACGSQADDASPRPTPAADASPPEPSDASDASAESNDTGAPLGFHPASKGIWIWYFDYVGMTAAQAADKAKSAGIGYVLIKSGQDGMFWTTRYTAAAVKEFTSRGILVLAWPYLTPADVQGDIATAVQAAAVPGTSGVVLDVEVEWEGNHAAEAQALCDGIRAKAPGIWLGYTSFGWAALHATFPFAAFDKHCGDGAFPQVYYSDRGVAWDGTKGLADALAQYKAAGLTAPVWPIQSNDDVAKTTAGPTVAELNGFFDAAGPTSSLWEFPAAGKTTLLDQLPLLHWKNP
jgi:hypothetical protein